MQIKMHNCFYIFVNSEFISVLTFYLLPTPRFLPRNFSHKNILEIETDFFSFYCDCCLIFQLENHTYSPLVSMYRRNSSFWVLFYFKLRDTYF